jgi:hypothetical protein
MKATSWAHPSRLVDSVANALANHLDAFNKAMTPGTIVKTDPAVQEDVDRMLGPALSHDIAKVAARFIADNEFVHVVNGVPAELVDLIRAEIKPETASRSVATWHRAAGSIGYRRIQAEAPYTAALYRSPVMLHYLRTLTGKPIQCKSDDDDHACTFYVYTRRGDHMGYHYDICGCEDAASYSLIIGIIDDSSQRLLIALHHDDPDRATHQLSVATPPGTLIAFAGSKVWHAVSPLGRNETRVSLGLAYSINDYQPPVRRLVKVSADTFFHFGLGGVVKKARGLIRKQANG